MVFLIFTYPWVELVPSVTHSTETFSFARTKTDCALHVYPHADIGMTSTRVPPPQSQIVKKELQTSGKNWNCSPGAWTIREACLNYAPGIMEYPQFYYLWNWRYCWCVLPHWWLGLFLSNKPEDLTWNKLQNG